MTDKWDPKNAKHNDIKKKIELGNGLPNLDTTDEVVEALHRLKWEVIEYKDLAIVDSANPVPWWQPLNPAWSLEGSLFRARITSFRLQNNHSWNLGDSLHGCRDGESWHCSTWQSSHSYCAVVCS